MSGEVEAETWGQGEKEERNTFVDVHRERYRMGKKTEILRRTETQKEERNVKGEREAKKPRGKER